MRNVKSAIKGCLNRLSNAFDHSKLILTYHGIRADADQAADPARLRVSVGHLQAHLATLRALGVAMVPLAELQRHPNRAVAITFDDGYADNLHLAAPVLRDADAPATVFLVSDWIGSTVDAWWDRLSALLLHDGELPDHCDLAHLPSRTTEQRRRVFDVLSARMIVAPPEQIESWWSDLLAWATITPPRTPGRRFVDREEAVALSRFPGISIGAHTCSHCSLAQQPVTTQQRELSDSKSRIESLIQQPVSLLAYPYGSDRDVDVHTIRTAKEAGFSIAVTTNPGQVHRWSDPLCLRRMTVRDWNGTAFASMLRQWWSAPGHGIEP